MKGLFIKDLCLFREMRKVLVIVLVLMCYYLFFGSEFNSVLISYIVIMWSIMVCNAISYDEADNGMAFLMTLPAGRSDYVYEKYVFGMFGCITGCVGASALSVLSLFIRNAEINWNEIVFALGASLIIAILMISVMIPLILKFGAEKGRIVIVLSVLICAMFVYGIKKGADFFQIDWSDMLNRVSFLLKNPIWLAVVLGGFTVLVFVISIGASLLIMKKKEF